MPKGQRHACWQKRCKPSSPMLAMYFVRILDLHVCTKTRWHMPITPLSVLDSRPTGTQEGPKLLALAECNRMKSFGDPVANHTGIVEVSWPWYGRHSNDCHQ